MADLKVLRALRGWVPLNVLSTNILRGLLTAVGARPEWMIKHLPRSGTVYCPLPGNRMMRLWSRGDDWISTQLFWHGWQGYEPETADIFYRLATRAQVALDVGAHVGFYSLLAAHANPAGQVFAFEPHPDIYPRLLRNVALNELTNVRCVASAIGETTGSTRLFHLGTPMPSSSSLSCEYMSARGAVESTVVAVTTVDEFLRESGEALRLDLVKIDIETTEPQVLRGMEYTLRRSRPAIICEVLEGQGTAAALERALMPLDYRYYLLTSDGVQPRERIVADARWPNHLFTPAAPDDLARQLACAPALMPGPQAGLLPEKRTDR
jgi:FkbM family methyltransferase